VLLQHRHYSLLNALNQGLSIFDFRFQKTRAKQRDGILSLSLSHSILQYFPSLTAVDKLTVPLMQKYAHSAMVMAQLFLCKYGYANNYGFALFQHQSNYEG
jgi:hypothetical protein